MRISQPQIRDISDDRCVQIDLMLIDQLSDPSAVNDFEIEPMLKSVTVVTGACAARSRKPYPFSSAILPSLINARPGTHTST